MGLGTQNRTVQTACQTCPALVHNPPWLRITLRIKSEHPQGSQALCASSPADPAPLPTSDTHQATGPSSCPSDHQTFPRWGLSPTGPSTQNTVSQIPVQLTPTHHAGLTPTGPSGHPGQSIRPWRNPATHMSGFMSGRV